MRTGFPLSFPYFAPHKRQVSKTLLSHMPLRLLRPFFMGRCFGLFRNRFDLSTVRITEWPKKKKYIKVWNVINRGEKREARRWKYISIRFSSCRKPQERNRYFKMNFLSFYSSRFQLVRKINYVPQFICCTTLSVSNVTFCSGNMKIEGWRSQDRPAKYFKIL